MTAFIQLTRKREHPRGLVDEWWVRVDRVVIVSARIEADRAGEQSVVDGATVTTQDGHSFPADQTVEQVMDAIQVVLRADDTIFQGGPDD